MKHERKEKTPQRVGKSEKFRIMRNSGLSGIPDYPEFLVST